MFYKEEKCQCAVLKRHKGRNHTASQVHNKRTKYETLIKLTFNMFMIAYRNFFNFKDKHK